MHLTVPGFTILGRLATPSREEFCALTGLSQVINSLIYFFAMLKLVPSPGYDRNVQTRIYHFLDKDDGFCAQIADLLGNKGTKIEIEEEMSNHPFVTCIPYVLLHEC